MTELSVIIPVYKIKEKYLRECLDSLICQEFDDWEALVIDDGSPDDSGKICDEYAEKDIRIKVIHQENQGVSIARNAGIKASAGNWITFIDPDDWIEHDWASTIFNAINLYGNETDIFLFDYYQNYAKKQFEKHLTDYEGFLSKETVKSLQLAPFNQFVMNGKMIVYETNVIWTKVYRSSLFKNRNIYFDPKAKKGQDVILNAEIFQLTDRYYYIRKNLYHYRCIQESVTNRFDPRVPYFNELAFEHYERIISKYSLGKEYKKNYYARVLTRLYSCMRLYYFHEDNTMTFAEICKAMDEKLNSKPYCDALENMDLNFLMGTYSVFVYLLKRRKYRILWILVNARLWLQKVKGAKLG